MKILVLNGPNLNLLGRREPEIYGGRDYNDLCTFITACCDEAGAECEIHQSNHEGEIVDIIQSAIASSDAIIINPAAYTHTSIAILDAVKAVNLPTVEVHLSDVSSREDFRKVSYVRAACIATFSGMGFDGYREAVRLLTM